MGPILPPTNLDVLLLMGRVPGSSAVAASRYEFILILLCRHQIDLMLEGRQFVISYPWLEMSVRQASLFRCTQRTLSLAHQSASMCAGEGRSAAWPGFSEFVVSVGAVPPITTSSSPPS